MRSVARKVALLLAVLAVPMVGMALNGGAQGDDSSTSSYLPDAQVRGLPASKYRVVSRSGDCKVNPGANPIATGVGVIIPGVDDVIDAVVPEVNAPDVLCPSVIAKDGIGGATSGAWSAGVYVVSVLTDGVEALLSFDVADTLRPLVGAIADRIDTKLVGPLELRHFALAFAALTVGFLFLTGRLIRAAGEALRVAILVGLSALIMSNVSGWYDTMSNLGRDATSAALSVSGDGAAAQPLDGIRESLIWGQWQSQQFGGELPPHCADAAFGAFRDSKSVLKAVDGAGCHAAAERAAESSWGRLFAAIAYLLLCLFIVWALARLAIGVIVAQIALAGSFILAPVACALAPIRAGRSLFGSWAGALIRLVAGMVFSGLLLSVAVLAVQAVLATPWPPFFRLLGAAVTTGVVGRLSHRWLTQLEQRTDRSTNRVVVGGLAAGVGVGAGAVAAQGLVSQAHRRSATVAGQVTARARGATTTAAQRVGGKVAAPVSKPIRVRREARHKLRQDASRQALDPSATKQPQPQQQQQPPARSHTRRRRRTERSHS